MTRPRVLLIRWCGRSLCASSCVMMHALLHDVTLVAVDEGEDQRAEAARRHSAGPCCRISPTCEGLGRRPPAAPAVPRRCHGSDVSLGPHIILGPDSE